MTGAPNLDKIKRKTVVAQVMDKIRMLISSGQFRAGDKMPTEAEMAEMFGIGRSSIREAIKVFNYLGVLDTQTAKGTFVCDRSNISTEALTWSILLGRDDYYELIDTRGAIETWSLMDLAEKHGRDPESVSSVLDELNGKIETMRSALVSGSREDLATADYEFHALIIAGQGNDLFNNVYRVLRAFMYEEIEKSHSGFADINTIIEDHRSFYDAIVSGDPMVAMATVRRHIQNIKSLLANVQRL